MSNLRSSPNTIIYSLLGISTHSSMIFTHLEYNNSQWLQHPKTFPRENAKYYSFVCLMAKERNHCSSLLSHIRRKFFSSQFSAIIQASQILIHLCASHKPQRILKPCYLILYICYVPSKNLFFISWFHALIALPPKRKSIFFFSLGFTLNSMIFLQSS